MVSIDKDEWRDLVRLLKNAEKSVVTMDRDGEAGESSLDACRDALKTFASTVAMLGLEDLTRAGTRLESFFEDRIYSNNGGPSAEDSTAFNFALNALIEEMIRAGEGDPVGSVDVANVLSILDSAEKEAAGRAESDDKGDLSEEELNEEAVIDELVGRPEDDGDQQAMGPVKDVLCEIDELKSWAAQLGATLEVEEGDSGESPSICLKMKADSPAVKRLLSVLSPLDNLESFQAHLVDEKDPMHRVLEDIKEFMVCLSEGNVERAQEILLKLSESSHPGLYREIGSLARELHDSLRDFVRAMDPALREIVEDKIPDSGNRLEHIIKLTESAANTTLDHVEALQKRNDENRARLQTIQAAIDGLHAIGEHAQEKLETVRTSVDQLVEASQKSHEDLIQILTAQDYQDLTGQIIMKIIALLEDLESKLIQLITKFGVKVEKTQKVSDELYGPAHEQMEEALHSQSDVDALLAEFGF